MGTITKTTEQLNTLADGAYGGFHIHDNSTPQSIPTGTTYTKLTTWDNNDESNHCTPDYTTGDITIDVAGDYKVECQLSMASGTANVVAYVSAFLEGVEQNQCHFTRKISVASDIGSASFTGIISANVGDILDLRARHDNAGSVDATLQYATFNCQLLGLGD